MKLVDAKKIEKAEKANRNALEILPIPIIVLILAQLML